MYEKTFRGKLDRYIHLENCYNEALCGKGDESPEKLLERLSLLSHLQREALLGVLETVVSQPRGLEVQASRWEDRLRKLKEKEKE